jgi:biotin carboxyl carrier protein
VTAYVALLDGGAREERVEVTRTGPGTYEVRLRGRVHVVDAFRHDHGTLSLLVDTESYAATLDERAGKVHVRVRGSVYPIELLTERRLRLRRAPGKLTVTGKQTVTAPIAGRVVKVLARAGDPVRAGQPVVAVEAMGMENELASPKDGRVVELHVAAGQAVEGNARLFAVE